MEPNYYQMNDEELEHAQAVNRKSMRRATKRMERLIEESEEIDRAKIARLDRGTLRVVQADVRNKEVPS